MFGVCCLDHTGQSPCADNGILCAVGRRVAEAGQASSPRRTRSPGGHIPRARARRRNGCEKTKERHSTPGSGGGGPPAAESDRRASTHSVHSIVAKSTSPGRRQRLVRRARVHRPGQGRCFTPARSWLRPVAFLLALRSAREMTGAWLAHGDRVAPIEAAIEALAGYGREAIDSEGRHIHPHHVVWLQEQGRIQLGLVKAELPKRIDNSVSVSWSARNPYIEVGCAARVAVDADGLSAYGEKLNSVRAE